MSHLACFTRYVADPDSAAAFLAVIITLSDVRPLHLSVNSAIVTDKQTSQPAYFQAGPKIYPICLLIVISSRISMAREGGSNHAYVRYQSLFYPLPIRRWYLTSAAQLIVRSKTR